MDNHFESNCLISRISELQVGFPETIVKNNANLFIWSKSFTISRFPISNA